MGETDRPVGCGGTGQPPLRSYLSNAVADVISA